MHLSNSEPTFDELAIYSDDEDEHCHTPGCLYGTSSGWERIMTQIMNYVVFAAGIVAQAFFFVLFWDFCAALSDEPKAMISCTACKMVTKLANIFASGLES